MVFIVCLPIAAAIAYAFNKKIEEGIPVAMFIATFVTYLLGIFGHLSISPVVVIVLAVLSLGYTVYGVFKEHSVKRYLTFGGVTFLLLGGYYGIVCRGRMIVEQDDLMVYGKYVADFYHVGKVYRYDYIPGLMMWEYLSEKFWTVFSESVLFWAVAMLCVAMMLAIFSNKEKKNNLYYFFALFFIVMFPLMTLKREAYFVLQGDCVMGITSAYILCMYHKAREQQDRFYYIASCAGLAFLTLSKSSGVFIAIIMLSLIIGLDLIDDSQKLTLSRSVYVIACAVAIAFSSISWMIFVGAHEGKDKFEGVRLLFIQLITNHVILIPVGIALIALVIYVIKLISEKGMYRLYMAILAAGAAAVMLFSYIKMPSDIRNDAVRSFIKVLFSTYAPDRYFGFGYRFYVPYAMLIVLLIFVWEVIKHRNTTIDATSNRLIASVHVGFALFASFIFLSGYYTRSASQVARAKESERYLYAYIVVYLVVYAYYFLKYAEADRHLYNLIIAFLTCMILLTANVGGLVSQVFEQDDFYNFDGLNYVNITAGTKFFYVDQKGELNYSRFNFRVSPGRMQNYYFSDMIVEEMYLGEGEPERYLTEEEWSEILKGCRYVYVAGTNDDFAEMYGGLFEDEIVDGRIYVVNVEDDRVILRSIEY